MLSFERLKIVILLFNMFFFFIYSFFNVNLTSNNLIYRYITKQKLNNRFKHNNEPFHNKISLTR